jgi:hypothetical protein
METFAPVIAEKNCKGIVTIHNKAAYLICHAAGCEVTATKDPVIFAKFPHNNDIPVSHEEIRRVGILEISDVCPRIADYYSDPIRKRLPEGLR